MAGRWRIVAALAMLLLACVDILAVDMTGHSTGAACSDTETHEDCFCCCRHVIVAPPASLQRNPSMGTLVPADLPEFQSRPAAVPFHPPRS